MKKKVLALVLAIVLGASGSLFSACQFFHDSSLENSTSSSSSSVEESSISSIEESSSSLPEIIEPCEKHTFGDWETVEEYACGTRKQRICTICETVEMNTITTGEQFLTHTFDENTLCTTCGHQEFIESEEYIESIKLSYYTWDGIDGILWWNKDRTYGLKILYFDARSHAIVKGFAGTPIHIRIPSHYQEIPIIWIAQPDEYSDLGTFQNCTTLKSIYIPDTVERIEDYAFDGCTNLESVRFSENLHLINGCAFRNCTSLKSLFLKNNNSTLSLERNAFENCISLTEIYFPLNVICWTSGDNCIKNCVSLKKIYIPEERRDYFTEKFIPYYPNLQIISYE